MTTKQFKRRVYKLVGNEYSVIGQYVNCKTKIKIRHNKCGHVYGVRPNLFKEGSRCPYCRENHKKTTSEFKKNVFNQVGKDYTVMSKYINNNTPIIMRHNKCGRIYKVLPREFLSGHRCIYCGSNHHRTTKEFKQIVSKIVGDEYTVLGNYKYSWTPIKMRHNKCGHVYYVKPSNFLTGDRCPHCRGTKLAKQFSENTSWFKQRVYKVYGDEYTVIGQYKNAQTPIAVRHNRCGHVWYPAPSNFPLVSSCPFCQSTHGEYYVSKFLKKYKIKYKYGYRLHNSRDYRKDLHLDFYLPKYRIGIEFDGIQHFMPVKHFGGNKAFCQEHYRDLNKDLYCSLKGIKLIRIENKSYTPEKFHSQRIYLKKIYDLVNQILYKKLLPLIKEILYKQ